MALAERTWERVGERKRDRDRLIESADICVQQHYTVQHNNTLCVDKYI